MFEFDSSKPSDPSLLPARAGTAPAPRPFREAGVEVGDDGRRWSVDGQDLMGCPIVPVGDSTRFEPNDDGLEAVSFEKIAWNILYPSPNGKLPSSAIIDVYIGLTFLFYVQGFPADGKVYFSRYQLLQLIRWLSPAKDSTGSRTVRPSGRHYKQLKRALLYLEGTRFVADDPNLLQVGPDGERFVGMQGFPILQYARIAEEGTGPKGESVTSGNSMVQFSEPFVALLGGGSRTTRLDFDLFLKLSPGTPRLLFRFLTWLQSRGQNTVALEELFPRIGSTQQHFVAARARQILDKAHAELRQRGVLAADPVYEKADSGYVVRYEFGDPARIGVADDLLLRAAEAFGVDSPVAQELVVAHRRQFERVLAGTVLGYIRPKETLPGMIVHYTRRGYDVTPRTSGVAQTSLGFAGDDARYVPFLTETRERALAVRSDIDRARLRAEIRAEGEGSEDARPDWVVDGLLALRLNQLLGLPSLAQFRVLDTSATAA